MVPFPFVVLLQSDRINARNHLLIFLYCRNGVQVSIGPIWGRILIIWLNIILTIFFSSDASLLNQFFDFRFFLVIELVEMFGTGGVGYFGGQWQVRNTPGISRHEFSYCLEILNGILILPMRSGNSGN